MVFRAEVATEMYAWARRRSGRDREYLAGRFPKLPEWESGAAAPTFRQLEEYAKATYTPVGWFFLPQPPADEVLPIPDFRTVGGRRGDRPSVDLLDTIYQCQRRQDWYQDYARRHGLDEVELVGSADAGGDPLEAAASMRTHLRFSVEERAESWSARFRQLADRAEQAGVLVMVNGVVGANTRRKLDPEEFRGFALVDERVPVVFVNGADAKAAQIFTLVHELAHIAYGESGLDSIDLGTRADRAVERWCNRVSAEFLAPMASLRKNFDPDGQLPEQLQKLARRFRVSTLVILRRLYDGGYLDRDDFERSFRAEHARAVEMTEQGSGAGGGNFYNTQPARVSPTFARALISSTLAGETTYLDAYRLLGIKKHSTFENLANYLVGIS